MSRRAGAAIGLTAGAVLTAVVLAMRKRKRGKPDV